MRGHRYFGASFARDFSRHFSSPQIPKPQAVNAAAQKTDAEIQAAAQSARLEAQRRRGRRSTVLTTGSEAPGTTSAGSITAPGAAVRLGAA